MKPEDASAIESLIFYYENPEYATIEKIVDCFENYNIRIYSDISFLFIECIRAPKYIMPSPGRDQTLHLCGGAYRCTPYPGDDMHQPWTIDTETYFFHDDARPLFAGNGKVYDFLPKEYRELIDGISIGPVSDFLDEYSVNLGDGSIIVDGHEFKGEVTMLPSTKWINAMTITEDKITKTKRWCDASE